MQNNSLSIVVPLYLPTRGTPTVLKIATVPSVDQFLALARERERQLGMDFEDALELVTDELYMKCETAMRLIRSRSRRAAIESKSAFVARPQEKETVEVVL